MKKHFAIASMLLSFSFASIPVPALAAPKKEAKSSKKKKSAKKKKKAGSGSSGADFSPMNFLPFGVGQFTQGRPLMGAVLGGGQAAMLFLYMDRKNQISASNKDADATIAEVTADNGTPDDETLDYLKRNADYVDKANAEATLCLVGFIGLWGVSVVEAVWDPFGSRKALSKKSAEVEEAEEDSAEQWAKTEQLHKLEDKGRFSAFAQPTTYNKNSAFGLSFDMKLR